MFRALFCEKNQRLCSGISLRKKKKEECHSHDPKKNSVRAMAFLKKKKSVFPMFCYVINFNFKLWSQKFITNKSYIDERITLTSFFTNLVVGFSSLDVYFFAIINTILQIKKLHEKYFTPKLFLYFPGCTGKLKIILHEKIWLCSYWNTMGST